ncbi:protein phosphatase Slingshot homolog 2b isoform X2 [Alosa sapidissima]|uniref:protein phosphatase Slingshot homolog 2b isoform X2 n=1 Tax=Alosa sapidissima TaxID=34773 RepID=UPI001C0870DA|nr:protein phosphatase Slingshot homolog 2b isoform X2 [Alosa sapidissima]
MALVTVQRSPTPSATSSPCVSESGSGEEDRRSQPRSISESFLTVKGAALFLPRGNGSPSSSRVPHQRSKHAGDLQQHLQNMFTLLRPEDNIKLAVRLESFHAQCTRYMVVVSTNGRQDTEESVVLGMDFSPTDGSCSIGMVLPLWSDTLIHLDGDGGFSVSTDNKIHVFKPVSVQAMWSALQSLHKACEVARGHNYFPGSLFLTWVSYYQSRVASDQARINEWNAMQDVQSTRPDSPLLFSDVPTERERTERLIKTRLREIMMQKDLENVTSKEIRTELEMQMTCNLREFKEYIDNEMIVILGQMDSPTAIFDHVFLGSEWNASNLEELQNSGVQYILNVTREIDNFFPGLFEYHNIRVYDEEATDLLAYWNDTYKFISRAKKNGAKCLVHCKMGVSRSAATVIAYAMKEYGWDLERAFDYVKERRTVTKPNPSFMRQLEEYQGILLASKQRHNKLWRSHSDGNLSEHHEPLVKPAPGPYTLGRSNPRNQSCTQPSPSLQEFLQSLSPSATTSAPVTQEAPETRVSNGFCDPQDPISEQGAHRLQLPQPRAATVVPEARSDVAAVTVAETVPVGRPHPPPALHHLPPTPVPVTILAPELASGLSEASSTVPDGNSDPPTHISVTKAARTFDSSSQAIRCVGEASKGGPSVQVPESKSNQKGNPAFFIGGEENEGSSDDDHLSATLEQVTLDAKPTLSTDHIDFFSAREKFLGLSQEGPAGCPLELTQQQHSPQERSPEPTAEPLVQDDPGNGDQQAKEASVSVHHIITELESVTHTVTPALSTACQSNPCSSNDNEEVELKRAEVETAPAEDQPTATPSTSGDCLKGTVRRATRELEQRLRQELEVPVAPVPTAAPHSPPRRSPVPKDKAEDNPPGQDSEQKPVTAQPIPPQTPDAMEKLDGGMVEGSVKKDDGKTAGVPQGAQELDSGGTKEASTISSSAADHHTEERPDGTSTTPSTDGLSTKPDHTSASSAVSVIHLEGVTEQDSGTDKDGLFGPRTEADLLEAWETLKELGAFLRQVRSALASDLGPSSWLPGRRGKRDPRERSRQAGARIRQAGLTTPSLMKRSASLAKLGSLELTANDLGDWDLDAAGLSPAHWRLGTAPTDDASKKKRVRPQHDPSSNSPPSSSSPSSHPQTHTEDPLRKEEARHHDDATVPLSDTAPHPSAHGRSDMAQNSGLTPQSVPDLISVATRQQYGRTHPLRRLKKRTVSFLYHTV